MRDEATRRDFLRATGAAAGVTAGGLAMTASPAKAGQHGAGTPIPGFDKPHTDVDLIPGVRAQGKGLKCYVQSDYAQKRRTR